MRQGLTPHRPPRSTETCGHFAYHIDHRRTDVLNAKRASVAAGSVSDDAIAVAVCPRIARPKNEDARALFALRNDASPEPRRVSIGRKASSLTSCSKYTLRKSLRQEDLNTISDNPHLDRRQRSRSVVLLSFTSPQSSSASPSRKYRVGRWGYVPLRSIA